MTRIFAALVARRASICAFAMLPMVIAPAASSANPPSDYAIGVHSETESMPGIKALRSALGTYAFRDDAPVDPSAPLPAAYGRLTYVESPAVDQRFRKDLIDGLSNASRGQVGPVIERGGPWKVVGDMIASQGLSKHNVVDVLATYLAFGWALRGEAQNAPNQANLKAVRAQLMSRPEIVASLASLTPAQRQIASEDFTYGVFLATVTTGAFEQRGETDRLKAYEASIRDDVRRQEGLDFSQLRLTSHGFEPAR